MLKELDLFRTKQYFAKESEYKHYPELVGAFYEESGNKKEPRRHVWRIDNRRDKKAKRLYELSLYEYKKAEVKDHEVHYIPTSETKKGMSWSLKEFDYNHQPAGPHDYGRFLPIALSSYVGLHGPELAKEVQDQLRDVFAAYGIDIDSKIAKVKGQQNIIFQAPKSKTQVRFSIDESRRTNFMHGSVYIEPVAKQNVV